MKRTDAPGATIDNLYTDGDPNLAIPATDVRADEMNHIQEEVANVIEGLGDTLDPGDRTQLYQNLIANFYQQSQVDALLSPLNNVVGAFFVHENSPPDMTVLIDTGWLQNGGSVVTQVPQVTINFVEPGVGMLRKDLVAVNQETGVYIVVTGIEHASTPANPTIPAGYQACAFVNLFNGMGAITNNDIEDVRVLGSGTEEVIDVAVTWRGDFSGDSPYTFSPVFPWSNPVKLPDPSEVFIVGSRSASWSPGGEFLAVSAAIFLNVYQVSGDKFEVIYSAALDGNAYDVEWSPCGEFLTVVHDGSPSFMVTYQRSGLSFTPLPAPVATPPSVPRRAAWSPTGEFLVICHLSSPWISIYQRDGVTLTKINNPSVLPDNNAWGAAWHPSGQFLAVVDASTPGLSIYERAGTTFTKLPDPAGLPIHYEGDTAWSSCGEFLAIGSAVTPFVIVLQKEGTTFTKLPDPDVLPGAAALGVNWHPTGKYLAVSQVASPNLTIYEFDGAKLTKLPDLAVMPAGGSWCCNWSPDGQFLYFGEPGAPGFAIHQTSSDMPENGLMRLNGAKRAGQ